MAEHQRVAISAVAALCATLVAILLATSLFGIASNHGIPSLPSWSTKRVAHSWLVAYVEPDGPAAKKLRLNDRVLSINGSVNALDLGPGLSLTEVERPCLVRIERRGRLLEFTLPVWKAPQLATQYCFFFLLALANFLLAIFIATAHFSSRPAQLAFFLFLSGAAAFSGAVLSYVPPPLSPGTLSFLLLFGTHGFRPLQWAMVFDFAVHFPESSRPRYGRRLLRTGFYVAGALISACILLPELADAVRLSLGASVVPERYLLTINAPVLSAALESFAALVLICTLTVFAAKYRAIPDRSARARLRWIALGLTAALTPILLEILAVLGLRLSGRNDLADRVMPFLDAYTVPLSGLVPVTFTYAIVKHQIMGIRFTLRRGLQYLLAKNVLRMIWYLPVIGLAAEVILHRKEPLQELLLDRSWWVYAFFLLSLSVTLRYRKPLERWVDAKFFRSAYEEELILVDLMAQLQACETSDEVARSVTTKLEQTFQSNGAAFLRNWEHGRFTVAFAHDAPFALPLCADANATFQNAFESQSFHIPYADGAIPAFNGPEGSLADRPGILATPIRTPDGQLDAVLLLGPRKSEDNYSKRDLKLLQAVATQCGLILEVLSLKERVREDGRVRLDVLAKLDKESVQLISECPQCGLCYTTPGEVTCRADGRRLVLTLPIERVIDGKYRLERRIGTGGMSAVYEAVDLRLGRIVAVKVLTGRLFGNVPALRRFEREARAVARLHHPNIVPVHDFGPLRGDGAFLVMQRISGPSWRVELDRVKAITPSRAATWFQQLCDGMIAAHDNGIIHRDLKPENLLISRIDGGEERVTVLDFGLAKGQALDIAAETLTADHSIIGTYAYMSPEQRVGERADARSDIYSCAVLVVETLTGIRPTRRGASQEWLHETLLWMDPTPASDQLLALLEACLKTSPSERVPTMQRLQSELVPLLRTCPSPVLHGVPATEDGSDGSDSQTLPM